MSGGPGSPSDTATKAAPGLRLKAEREGRGLSVEQVAEDLHVSVATVQALEAGRFAALGAPVFAKGHLRKYARLLGLDAEKMVSASETEQPALPELVPLKPATRARRVRVSPSVIEIVIAAVVIAAMGWLLWPRAERPARPSAPAVASPPAMPPEQTAQPAVETRPATRGDARRGDPG